MPERPRRRLGNACHQVLRHIGPPVAAVVMLRIASSGELFTAPLRFGSRLVVFDGTALRRLHPVDRTARAGESVVRERVRVHVSRDPDELQAKGTVRHPDRMFHDLPSDGAVFPAHKPFGDRPPPVAGDEMERYPDLALHLLVPVLRVGRVVGRGHEVQAPAIAELDVLLFRVVIDEFRSRRNTATFLSRQPGRAGHRVPAAMLAAVSGGSAFANHTIIAGALAMLVAALAAIITLLHPRDLANAHHLAGVKYNSLRQQTRIFRSVDLQTEPVSPDARQRLSELTDARGALGLSSPQIPRRAFERARQGIEQGEAEYAVDANQQPPEGP